MKYNYYKILFALLVTLNCQYAISAISPFQVDFIDKFNDPVPWLRFQCTILGDVPIFENQNLRSVQLIADPSPQVKRGDRDYTVTFDMNQLGDFTSSIQCGDYYGHVCNFKIHIKYVEGGYLLHQDITPICTGIKLAWSGDPQFHRIITFEKP